MIVDTLSFVTLQKVLKQMIPIQMCAIHLYHSNSWIIEKINHDVSDMEFHLRTYDDFVNIKIFRYDVTNNPYWMDDDFKWGLWGHISYFSNNCHLYLTFECLDTYTYYISCDVFLGVPISLSWIRLSRHHW